MASIALSAATSAWALSAPLFGRATAHHGHPDIGEHHGFSVADILERDGLVSKSRAFAARKP